MIIMIKPQGCDSAKTLRRKPADAGELDEVGARPTINHTKRKAGYRIMVVLVRHLYVRRTLTRDTKPLRRNHYFCNVQYMITNDLLTRALL